MIKNINGKDYEVEIDLGDGNYGAVSDPTHTIGHILGTPFLRFNEALLWTPKKLYFCKTFYFRDTMGLPLSFIFDRLQQLADEAKYPVTPCLLEFRSNALTAGWSDRKVSADMREALGETFGAKVADGLMEDLGKVVFVPLAGQDS